MALRAVLTWIYNGTGPSVVAVVVCQASSNVAWSLFPNHGSHLDPVVAGVLAAAAATVLAPRSGGHAFRQRHAAVSRSPGRSRIRRRPADRRVLCAGKRFPADVSDRPGAAVISAVALPRGLMSAT